MRYHPKKGFTLVEVLIAIAVFTAMASGIYLGFTTILRTMNVVRVKTIMTNIANEQFEIIRNMPYQNVGLVSGIPVGTILATQPLERDGKTFVLNTTIRNYDDPFDGTFNGSPKDLSPADMKLIELNISCEYCGEGTTPISFTTKVGPKNLETASTNGALIVRVFNASGLPVAGADVNIINTSINPNINLNDVTDINGVLTIVDAPPSVDGYKIIVSKDGYSTEETYPIGEAENPNPIKPNVTVVVQQITQISFTIDELSTVNVSSINSQCVATPNFDFSISGNKLIGTSPDKFKYSKTKSTSGGGLLSISDLEWDTYMISGIDSVNDIIGTNPLLSLGVNPNVNQDLEIITAPKNGRRLLVVVRDQSTGLPITDATVTVTGPSSYSKVLVTNEGFITQTDWSEGGGQELFENPNMYLSISGGIDDDVAGELRLSEVFGTYNTGGNITSSTFDIGAPSNFKQIIWNQITQPIETGGNSVRAQIATNNDNLTWNFVGPDGTNASYYTSVDQNINSSHNGDRYFRYRLYLSTEDTGFTPSVSDVTFTFSSACIPPGQVSFSNLSTGSYTIDVDKDSYQSTSRQVDISNNWTKEEITITP